MEELESRALATFTNPPSLYGRYVDDTICVIQKDQINAFHQHLDSQDPNIKFTVERYSDDGLPFLDTLNKVLDDGTIDVSIFRKKTHTDRYLHFSSHHPPQHKAAVVRTLVHRTEPTTCFRKIATKTKNALTLVELSLLMDTHGSLSINFHKTER
ncbi:hypothetical protein QZH41_001394 [Actinostola sp. cb2023]|nr:hypothetical protein QZH41_001394 [Actinostola sp. cb2023]